MKIMNDLGYREDEPMGDGIHTVVVKVAPSL